MSIVYVVQQPKVGPNNFTYDISPAMQYGDIVFVFEGSEQPGLTPAPSMRKAKKVLRNYSKDSDFILWAGGDPAALAIVAAALGSFKFLRWERERENGVRTKRGFYIPVTITGE